MSNHPSNNIHDATHSRRRVDIISLVVAIVLLAVAAIGIGGDTWWLIPNLLPWLIAGAAAAVGLGLIASSLPWRRR